jgi:capsular polysaccharide export protein
MKPSARWPRRIATLAGVPYLALEDGFIRSRFPGHGEPTLSYICDPAGIYYDAARPSLLEAHVRSRLCDPVRASADAAPVFDAIRRIGLSKYAHADAADRAAFMRQTEKGPVIVLADQAMNDAAVSGAGADRDTFRRMLIAAVEENPDARIALKVHPETRMGRRRGYLDDGLVAEARRTSAAVGAACAAGRIFRFAGAIAPRDLFARTAHLYVVSSLLGLEGLIAGVPVSVFGQAFYAGWGLARDLAPTTGRRVPVPLECLVAAAYRDYAVYLSPRDRRIICLEAAIGCLAGSRPGTG